MWIPKSPWQWAAIIGLPLILCCAAFGFITGLFIVGIALGSYFFIAYVLKAQKAPAQQRITLPNTNSPDNPVTEKPAQAVVPMTPMTDAERYPKKYNKKDMAFAVPNYDVPHVAFTRTPDGFTVSFNKAKIGIHRGISNVSQMKHGTGLAAVGSGVAGLGALAAIGAMRLAQGVQISK